MQHGGWQKELERGYAFPLSAGEVVWADRTRVGCSRDTKQSRDFLVYLRDGLPAISDDSSLWEILRRVAERDVQRNVVEDDGQRYLGAGSDFGPKVFTRDIAFSGLLGLNARVPDLMDDSLRFTRRVRRRTGFKVPRRFTGLSGDVPWERLDMSDDDFVARYGTNSYLNRTDDVCWIAALADLYRQHPSRADWSFLETEGRFFFEEFYGPFYDETDGLYRGQATFVDIGYPNPLGTGYADSLALTDRIRIKALSTNCFYVWGLSGMAEAAVQNGNHIAARKWRDQKEALIRAIRNSFLNGDGTLSYYKSVDDSIETRRDALGTSLAVLTGVVSGDEAARALKGYPMSESGVPLFDPFFPDERWYHNHSSWPFVDAFFLRALTKAEIRDYKPLAAMWLGLACDSEAGFREVRDYRTGAIKGSGAQLWTAAAFLGLDQPWTEERVAE